MASITKTTNLSASSDEVWEVLRDPGRANELITFLGEVTVEGNKRVCALGDDVLEYLDITLDALAARRIAAATTPLPQPTRNTRTGNARSSASISVFCVLVNTVR